MTAGDRAKVKVFVLPVPPTPSESTTHPTLDSKYPLALTHEGAASGLQILSGDRLLFSQSSFKSPNDAYIIGNLKALESDILSRSDYKIPSTQAKLERITNFSAVELDGKILSGGDEFWFTGAEGKLVQGWVMKPRGWREGKTKEWPVVLLIHGGVSSVSNSFWFLLTYYCGSRTSRRLGGSVVDTVESK